MEENVKSLANFFESDAKIKEILAECAPTNLDTQDTVIEYSNKLMKAIETIEVEMNKIFSQKGLPTSMFKENVMELLGKIKNQLESTMDPNKLKEIYKRSFSDMSPKFVEDVGKVCVGYTTKQHFNRDGSNISLFGVAAETKTINEMLHLLHSYICNDDNMYKMLPVVERKKIGRYGDCTLFGEASDIAKDIYDSMPENQWNSELGETYIIGLKNRALMMVRDSGHALTIDIEEDKEKGKVFVKYFVPKICNIEKLNKLKGIHKIPTDAYWRDMSANGMYETSIDGFGTDIVNFIQEVPTDMDMEIDNSWIYQNENEENEQENIESEVETDAKGNGIEVEMQEQETSSVPDWMKRMMLVAQGVDESELGAYEKNEVVELMGKFNEKQSEKEQDTRQ